MAVSAAQLGNYRVSLVMSTPELVDALLDNNTRNRRVKKEMISRLTRTATTGGYRMTTSAIGVHQDGTTVDGQNRLFALRAAGYPVVPLMILYGLTDEDVLAIDTGTSRGAADQLHFLFNED